MRSTFPLLLLLPSVIILLVGPGIHKAHRRSVGSTAPDQHHQEDEALGQALNGGLADRQGEQQWAGAMRTRGTMMGRRDLVLGLGESVQGRAAG